MFSRLNTKVSDNFSVTVSIKIYRFRRRIDVKIAIGSEKNNDER